MLRTREPAPFMVLRKVWDLARAAPPLRSRLPVVAFAERSVFFIVGNIPALWQGASTDSCTFASTPFQPALQLIWRDL